MHIKNKEKNEIVSRINWKYIITSLNLNFYSYLKILKLFYTLLNTFNEISKIKQLDILIMKRMKQTINIFNCTNQ